jgi:hypothetical protein
MKHTETESEFAEPLFMRNGMAMQFLAIRTSTYWKLVREREIVVVGKGRSSRAYIPSLKRYAAKLLAEAEGKTGKAA